MDAVVKVDHHGITVKIVFAKHGILKDIPARRWDPVNKVWRFPATPAAAVNLLAKFNEYSITYENDDKFDNLLNMGRRVEFIKNHPLELPPIPCDNTKPHSPPWLHQIQGYHLIDTLPACLLEFHMGTGKTRVVIDYLSNHPEVRTILVVCPKSVVPVWEYQAGKHGLKNVNVVLYDSGPIKTRAAIMKQYLNHPNINPRAMHVINYDSVWRPAMAEVVKSIKWDMIVADEIHRIKSPGSKVSMFMARSLTAIKKVGLTGTIMPHSPMDVYGSYRFLDPAIFGTSFTVFRSNYAVMGGYLDKQILKYKNQQHLHDSMYSIALRITKNEAITLPDQVFTEVFIELSSETRDQYNELQHNFILEVEQGVITAKNALSKIIKLQQLISGYANIDGQAVELNVEKPTALADILEDISINEPVVVFCVFHWDIKQIRKVVEASGRRAYELSGKLDELRDWQADKTGSVLIAQIRKGSEGVDMTRASYCVYYTLPWSLGVYEQSLARLHRPGQKNNVTYIHILTVNTIDTRIYHSLINKKSIIESILEYYKNGTNQVSSVVNRPDSKKA